MIYEVVVKDAQGRVTAIITKEALSARHWENLTPPPSRLELLPLAVRQHLDALFPLFPYLDSAKTERG